jgi:hypothetical protein
MGRVLTSIASHEPEAHGLLALMELNASRTAAPTDAKGEPILLLDQYRALWDRPEPIPRGRWVPKLLQSGCGRTGQGDIQPAHHPLISTCWKTGAAGCRPAAEWDKSPDLYLRQWRLSCRR